MIANAEKARILLEIRALLKEPKSWIKAAFAVDKKGHGCQVHNSSAVAFCLLGAARRVGTEGEVGIDVLVALINPDRNRCYPWTSVADWNDALNRNHLDVLRLLDDGIKKYYPSYVPPKLSLWQRFRSWSRKGI